MTNSISATEAATAHFTLDAMASKFTVKATVAGLLSAIGHSPTIGIRSFRGEVDFNAEALQARGLTLAIQAASLSVLDDVSQKDRDEMERLMREQVLETAKFPGITYQADNIVIAKMAEGTFNASLNGNLSLHGVTRSLPVTARIAPFGTMLRASGEFIVKQSDYQIKPISVAGGALKVKDELRLSFEMVARK